MSRPLFGPARKHLGHPATTRFLDSLMTDEERQEQQRLQANNAAVKELINEMLDRREAEKAS